MDKNESFIDIDSDFVFLLVNCEALKAALRYNKWQV